MEGLIILYLVIISVALGFIWSLWIGPRQGNLVLIAYASSEGSGEPAHPRSLARTFAARSYKQWVKRNLQTESQIPGPAEWLGMRSWNLSWRNARRHKFAWRGPINWFDLYIWPVVGILSSELCCASGKVSWSVYMWTYSYAYIYAELLYSKWFLAQTTIVSLKELLSL